MRPRFFPILAVLLTALLVGCDRVSDQRGGDARMIATERFGSVGILDAAVPSGRSVMDALRGATPVETAFGGGFVSAIGELRSDPGGQRDWFYYMNGVSPGRGADQLELRPGDAVWWDYRSWGALPDAWAVVGLWPEPFVNGYPDPPEVVAADPPLDAALRAAGAPVGTGPTMWRVRVGTDAELRNRDPAWRRAMDDPAAQGLTVRIDGGAITAMDAEGTFRPVPDARAFAAAVLTGSTPEAGGVLLAVAGLDAAAARAAAARIARDPAVLRTRFAVVFDGGGEPLTAGGRDGG